MAKLNEITELNEHIKQVVKIADGAYLVAINAMFQARKAKGKAEGFAVVTTELRKFSAAITLAMEELEDGIYRQLHLFTKISQRQHMERLIDRLKTDYPTSNRHYIEQFINNAHEAKQVYQVQLRSYQENFRRQLMKADRVCEMGHTLQVLARVEASSAGVIASNLLSVVNQIEKTISTLETILQEVNRLFGRCCEQYHHDQSVDVA